MSMVNGLATVPDTGFGASFSLWRHRDAAVRFMPHAHLGEHTLGGDVADEARRAYEAGARFVSIEPTVELGAGSAAAETIPVLSFVRELTSYGMEVDWRARLASDSPEWWVFSHLFPPSVLDGPGGEDVLATWRSKYHVGRCFLRRGPGFVQIRDRRHGGFRRFIIADGDYLAAIDALLADRGADSVPDQVVSAFEKQHLLVRIGGGVWWAPYRLQRWPLPSWEV